MVTVTRKYLQLDSLALAGISDFQSQRKPTGFSRCWTITDDGWLQIVGEHDSLLSENTQSNLLWYPLPDGDFVITVHLKTNPFANFHQASIFIYEDAENHITINRGYCDICQTGGGGFYMDYKIGGNWGNYQIATDAEDVFLRLESKDNIISGYYATEPDQWERLGRFGNYFNFQRVGICVSNVGASEDVVGLFDYFEVSRGWLAILYGSS